MTTSNVIKVPLAEAKRFVEAVFAAAGVAEAAALDATRSMLHGSLYGVDSHGVRLTAHYMRAYEGGRINKNPKPVFTKLKAASGLLDGDHSQGAHATYVAMDKAMELARETGIAAVGVQNSSHFGPAGAYAKYAADKGFIAFATCNSDSFVRLHDGASRFHGTNPLSFAAPSGEADPWLLDMATSSIPFNRVELYRSLGVPTPAGTTSDEYGRDTTNANEAAMLAPLGGEFGFKGAALGGVAEIFSAVLTGMKLSPELLPMGGPDYATPRQLGAFVLAIDPDGFIGAALFEGAMKRYLEALRNSPAREGCRVMAPGDREWEEAARRREQGVPIDPATREAFEDFSRRYGVPLPW